jgi:hypothetical protein
MRDARNNDWRASFADHRVLETRIHQALDASPVRDQETAHENHPDRYQFGGANPGYMLELQRLSTTASSTQHATPS